MNHQQEIDNAVPQPDQGEATAGPWARAVPWLLMLLYLAHRFWFVLSGRGTIDSDEGVYGIMALEILRGDFMVFFHGQDYMGAFQAFAAAPFIALFGANPMSLRLLTICEGALLLLLWRYILGRWQMAAVWPWFALFFAVPPDLVTVYTIKLRGIMSVLLLGSAWLALLVSITTRDTSFEQQRWRWFALGLLTGLGWWTSQLVLYFYLPTMLWLLLSARFRGEFSSFVGRGNSWRIVRGTIGVVLVATLGLLFLRGTTDYSTDLSVLLYEYRVAIIALHGAAIGAYAAGMRWLGLPRWFFLLAMGVLIAYLPPLFVVLGKETLYNTFRPGGIDQLAANIATILFISGGGMFGILDRAGNPIGLPVGALIAVPCVYALTLLLLIRRAATEWRAHPGRPGGLLLLCMAIFGGFTLLAYSLNTQVRVSHYAVPPMFFVLIALGWMCASLFKLNRFAPLPVVGLLLWVNVHSNRAHERIEIDRRTMIPTSERQLLEFLAAENITAGATNLVGPMSGYWIAYRLSFSSGERFVLHPVMHMPRIDRYREALRTAETMAIVNESTEPAEELLRRHNISYEVRQFGTIRVIYNFDKREAERRGLVDYRESL